MTSTIRLSRTGAQVTTGATENLTLTGVALAIRPPDHITREMSAGTLAPPGAQVRERGQGVYPGYTAPDDACSGDTEMRRSNRG